MNIFTTFDVAYHNKSALMNLNLCLAIKHHPIIIILAQTPEIEQGLQRFLSCGARKPELGRTPPFFMT